MNDGLLGPYAGGGRALLRSTKAIINLFSSSGWAGVNNAAVSGGRALDSGSTTANTLKTIFSATGSGVIHGLAVKSNNVTSRTIRARLTIDGVVVFDSTSAAITTTDRGAVIVGGFFGTGQSNASAAAFNYSAVFEIASSLTETDGIQTQYILFGS